MTLFCELDGVAPLARQKQIDTLWFTSSTGQAERGCWVAFIPRYPVCGFTQVVVAQTTADYLGLTALICVKSIKQQQAQVLILVC